MARYYLDTSIWLDLFEDRNEQNLPKGKYAERLMNKIVSENCLIVLSDIVKGELIEYGYTERDLIELFKPFEKILIDEEVNDKQLGKAKDLAKKRAIPRLDAVHALIARDAKALMISRDAHFRQLKDVVRCAKPEELI